jgi:hypothetical protein
VPPNTPYDFRYFNPSSIEKEIIQYIKLDIKLIPRTQSQGIRVSYEARVKEPDKQLKQLENGLKKFPILMRLTI